ncbi:NADP-dependent oxidoreductase [Oceanicoccus sp. KOV_DT_Chl]|uniref:NADP-dependent oxidoreductase n=1 Tax=Oceanicoccus sp. KOV_DT_Chl TaxID=1904639 RepID=UPI000C7BD75B|nr:NADP-dependent oxidoreductase [Oceanicoccus sp. KOV_DT_Chl]
MTASNAQWLLRRRPQGMVTLDDFEYKESPMPSADLAAGDVLVKNLYLSFDPAMRGWMDDAPSYLPPVAIGEPMRASAVGQVIASENTAMPVGSLVQGMFGWQQYAVSKSSDLFPAMALPEGTPPTMPLSIFGGTSLTAYFGLLDVGQLQAGDTVLVSGAAGATGSAAAQMAKLKNCTVIGIAGGEEKCQWLRDECKLDAVIDYKSENIEQRIGEICRQLDCEGINVFYDNVGGDTLEAGIEHMAKKGRIVLCGQISAYNDEQPQPGPKNLMKLVVNSIRMEGFVMIDFMDRIDEAMNDIVTWVLEGKIAYREDIQEGFDNIPATFFRLFAGQNTGKQLLKIADPE